nr:hypothetical protein [Streptococcus dysgalactiae]
MIDDLLTKGTNSLKKIYSLPRLIGVVLAIFLILTLSFVIWGKEQSQTKLPIVSTSSSIQQPASEEKKYPSEESNILVDLKGAVQQEGVYKLRANSRVRDVIELAGDLLRKLIDMLLILQKNWWMSRLCMWLSRVKTFLFCQMPPQQVKLTQKCLTQQR